VRGGAEPTPPRLRAALHDERVTRCADGHAYLVGVATRARTALPFTELRAPAIAATDEQRGPTVTRGASPERGAMIVAKFQRIPASLAGISTPRCRSGPHVRSTRSKRSSSTAQSAAAGLGARRPRPLATRWGGHGVRSRCPHRKRTFGTSGAAPPRSAERAKALTNGPALQGLSAGCWRSSTSGSRSRGRDHPPHRLGDV